MGGVGKGSVMCKDQGTCQQIEPGAEKDLTQKWQDQGSSFGMMVGKYEPLCNINFVVS